MENLQKREREEDERENNRKRVEGRSRQWV